MVARLGLEPAEGRADGRADGGRAEAGRTEGSASAQPAGASAPPGDARRSVIGARLDRAEKRLEKARCSSCSCCYLRCCSFAVVVVVTAALVSAHASSPLSQECRLSLISIIRTVEKRAAIDDRKRLRAPPPFHVPSMPPPALPRVTDGAPGEFGRNASNGPTREVVVNIPPDAHVGQRLKILARAPRQLRDATTARRHNKKTPRVHGRSAGASSSSPCRSTRSRRARCASPCPRRRLSSHRRAASRRFSLAISANSSYDLG